MTAVPASVQRWKCICAYDGTAFAGWQSQAGGRAIQDIVEAVLAKIFGMPIRIHGSGRTDSGVHALAQVFHFDASWRHGPEKLVAAFRLELPESIQVRRVHPARPDFHSRFQAVRKRYVYHIHLGDPGPFARRYCWGVFRTLDLAAMKAAAGVLRGRHDFRAFTALNGPEREDTVRHLSVLKVVRSGNKVRIVAEADGFLYKMMRSLAGAIVAAGEGKLTTAEVAAVLASRERTHAVKTAPPHGLFLERVYYR